jgi:hypothetical protein
LPPARVTPGVSPHVARPQTRGMSESTWNDYAVLAVTAALVILLIV